MIFVVFGLLHAETIYTVDEMKLECFKNLKHPVVREFSSGIEMAISASNAEVQAHVLQGLNAIHGGWDFEAYRHFVLALEKDPQCLMAYFGIAFSTQGDGDEFTKVSVAAIDRALAMVQANVGTALEQSYVRGLHELVAQGPQAAAEMFGRMAKSYPNDLQLALFEIYFLRSGFDEYGVAKEGQRVAQEKLQSLLKKYPESSVLMNAWLVIRAENPAPAPADLEMARKLSTISAEFPPYQHVLGHYEWRAGNFAAAAQAFLRTTQLYDAWMKESQLEVIDCPDRVRAECYRAVALSNMGAVEPAFQIAETLTKLSIPKNRVGSAGARMILWEARTLAARLHHRHGGKGHVEKAIASLPKPTEVNSLASYTKAATLYQGLMLYFEGVKSLEQSDVKKAGDVATLMNLHGNQMTKAREATIKWGEISAFARAFATLEILTADLQGTLTFQSGQVKSAAYNWFAGARDRQSPASRMMPPIILLPMHAKTGRFYLDQGSFDDAVEEFDDGLKLWPNDLILLEGKKEALTRKEDTSAAMLIRFQIEEIRAQK
jgi:tetratricopeptide (TPR) repeat protein